MSLPVFRSISSDNNSANSSLLCQYLAEVLLQPLRHSSSLALSSPEGLCSSDPGVQGPPTFAPMECLAAEAPLKIASDLLPLRQKSQEHLQVEPEDQLQQTEQQQQQQQWREEMPHENHVDAAPAEKHNEETPDAPQLQRQLQSASDMAVRPEEDERQPLEQPLQQPDSNGGTKDPAGSKQDTEPQEVPIAPPEETPDMRQPEQQRQQDPHQQYQEQDPQWDSGNDEESSAGEGDELQQNRASCEGVAQAANEAALAASAEVRPASESLGWHMSSRRRTSSIFVSPLGDWGAPHESPFVATTAKQQPQGKEQQDIHVSSESEGGGRGTWQGKDNIEELLLQSLKKHFGCSRGSSISIVQKKGRMLEALFATEGPQAASEGLAEWTEGLKEGAAEAARRLESEPQKTSIVVQIYYNGSQMLPFPVRLLPP